MFIQCWSFQKRPNSTKQPNPGDPNMIFLNDVQLKENTSVLSPTLRISPVVDGLKVNPSLFNYVCIPQWERYYYVNGWRYCGNVWEVDLAVDTLASFREMIGDTEAYIVRSSAVFDGSVIDTLYPTRSDVTFMNIPVNCVYYNVAPSGGCYVIGVINYLPSHKIGAVTYYALTSQQFAAVLSWLFGDTIANSQVNIDQGLFKAIFNPMQYFTTCMWFPFSAATFGNETVNIEVGYWNTGASGIVLKNLAQKTFLTATIPNHPQISRGEYLNRAPYTRLCLYAPPFGSIPIDTNVLSKGNYLYSSVLIDHVTGQATLRISVCEDQQHVSEFNIISERTGQIGVPILLAQVLVDYYNQISQVSSGVANMFAGAATGGIGGAIAGALSTVGNAIAASFPQVSASGSNGSFSTFAIMPILTAEYYLLTDENRTEYGRPLCQKMKISSIPGYIKCGEADHQFPGTQGERDEINKYLVDGFFYE